MLVCNCKPRASWREVVAGYMKIGRSLGLTAQEVLPKWWAVGSVRDTMSKYKVENNRGRTLMLTSGLQMHLHEQAHQPTMHCPSQYFLRSLTQLDWLMGKHWRPSWLLPVLDYRLKSMYPASFCGSWGIKLQHSSLCGNHFTKWMISPIVCCLFLTGPFFIRLP